jgi:hypothetical protein
MADGNAAMLCIFKTQLQLLQPNDLTTYAHTN